MRGLARTRSKYCGEKADLRIRSTKCHSKLFVLSRLRKNQVQLETASFVSHLLRLCTCARSVRNSSWYGSIWSNSVTNCAHRSLPSGRGASMFWPCEIAMTMDENRNTSRKTPLEHEVHKKLFHELGNFQKSFVMAR